MKKTNAAWIIAAIIAACAILGPLVLQTVNFNRLGGDAYYTKIEGAGTKINEDLPDGYVRYEYELPAYNNNGEAATLPFTADKQLREDAYLKLYVKEGKGVTSYQEVSFNDIPEAVQQMLGH